MCCSFLLKHLRVGDLAQRGHSKLFESGGFFVIHCYSVWTAGLTDDLVSHRYLTDLLTSTCAAMKLAFREAITSRRLSGERVRATELQICQERWTRVQIFTQGFLIPQSNTSNEKWLSTLHEEMLLGVNVQTLDLL